jgi:hypothetical protein
MKRYMRITNTLTGEFEDKELNEKQLALFPLSEDATINASLLQCDKCPCSGKNNSNGVSYGEYVKKRDFGCTKGDIKIELLSLFEPTEQDIMNCKTIGDLPNGVYCIEAITGELEILYKNSHYALVGVQLTNTLVKILDSEAELSRCLDWEIRHYEFLGSL